MSDGDARPPAWGAAAGGGIVRWAVGATIVFTAVSVAATAVEAMAVLPLIVDPLLFLAGIVVFTVALVRAAQRSRTEQFGIMQLFFLEGAVAPVPIRRRLLGSLVAQIVVSIATAALRANTTVAFGILVPVYGIAMAGLWGARYGTFAPRTATPGKGARARR